MSYFQKRQIKNFQPNLKAANKLFVQRFFPYFYGLISFLILQITLCLILYFTSGIKELKILLLVLAIGNLLVLITVAWIFDYGAAQKLRKNNFKTKGIRSLQQGHTFYYALMKLCFYRLIINSFPILLIIIFVFIIF